MYKFHRRLFSERRPGPPPSDGGPEASVLEGTSRRAFIAGTGAAVGSAAVVLATPKVAAITIDSPGSSVPVEPQPVPTAQTGPAPHEPVTAYVRNADRGEVTVMAGQQETTYRDPALVKRLLDAAR